ncbi:MAG: hypothetical protein ACTSU2_08495 [Promethearchaeota archaeon]
MENLEKHIEKEFKKFQDELKTILNGLMPYGYERNKEEKPEFIASKKIGKDKVILRIMMNRSFEFKIVDKDKLKLVNKFEPEVSFCPGVIRGSKARLPDVLEASIYIENRVENWEDIINSYLTDGWEIVE